MKSARQIIILTCLFVTVSLLARGQNKIITENLLENMHRWCEGDVYLSDGTKLSGLVRYDDNSGILSYKNGEISKSLIAKNTAGFAFYDEEVKKRRYFFSREYDDGLTSSKFYFFEVLREFGNFSVLSKVDAIDVQVTNGSGPYRNPYTGTLYGGSGGRTAVAQTETIFIMDEEGSIQPYIHILEREVGGWLGGKSTRNKYLNRSLLEKYTAPHYERIRGYAKDKGLNMRRKSELLTVLDYYGSLLE